MKIAMGQPCPLCEKPLQLHTLPDFSGDEAPLRMTLSHMPVLECDAHHRYFVDPEFPLWMMNHLVQEDEAGLPAGRAKGFFIKHYECGACGEDLEAKADHRQAFRVDLQFRQTQPFSAEISMPVFRCAACGKEQLHSLDEVRKLTPAALVHAFKESGIKPPA